MRFLCNAYIIRNLYNNKQIKSSGSEICLILYKFEKLCGFRNHIAFLFLHIFTFKYYYMETVLGDYTKEDLVKVIALLYEKNDDMSKFGKREELLKQISNICYNECYRNIGWQLSVENKMNREIY